MNTETKTWLYDILKSIEEIESYFTDVPKDFFEFQRSLKTKRAVERNIEIIGEAMNRISNLTVQLACRIQEKLLIRGTELFTDVIPFPTI